MIARRAESWYDRSEMLGAAAEGRPVEATDGRLLQKLASDSRRGTGVERYCQGSAVLVGVGGGGRRSGAKDSAGRRRPGPLIVGGGFVLEILKSQISCFSRVLRDCISFFPLYCPKPFFIFFPQNLNE